VKEEKEKRCPRCGLRLSEIREKTYGSVRHCFGCHFNYPAEEEESDAGTLWDPPEDCFEQMP